MFVLFREVEPFPGTLIRQKCCLVSLPLSPRSLNPIPVCSGEETKPFSALSSAAGRTSAWFLLSPSPCLAPRLLCERGAAVPRALESAGLAGLHSDFPEMCGLLSFLKAAAALWGECQSCSALQEHKGRNFPNLLNPGRGHRKGEV